MSLTAAERTVISNDAASAFIKSYGFIKRQLGADVAAAHRAGTLAAIVELVAAEHGRRQAYEFVMCVADNLLDPTLPQDRVAS